MDIKRRTFCVDVLAGIIEAGLYTWFVVQDYEWFDPGVEGGTADPALVDGVPVNNIAGKIRAINPENEITWMPWQELGPYLIERAIDVIEDPQCEIKGLSQERREQLMVTIRENDVGLLDMGDIDTLTQIGVLGYVPFT